MESKNAPDANEPTPVLLLDNSYTFGGAINALETLVSAIDPERFRPIVVSAQDPAFVEAHFAQWEHYHWNVSLPWVEDRFDRRITALRLMRLRPLRTAWLAARAGWWLLFRWLPEAFWLARLGRRHRVRLIHLNNGVEGMLPGVIAASLLRVPIISHARGPHSVDSREVRALIRRVSGHIAVSEHVAENLVETGVDPDRISVVHDAVDLNTFSPGSPPDGLREEIGLPAAAPVVGFFGRVVEWKGVREFVQGAGRALTHVPEAHAIVVGDPSDGARHYFDQVVADARATGVGDRIHFLGFREDTPALLRLCDVAVHTSTMPEPFGLVVIEAMASGTAVVAARSGGPLETVVDGETGLLADPTDTPALACAITELLVDTDRARKMGQKGVARARRLFSSRRHAGEVMAVYREVLEAGRP